MKQSAGRCLDEEGWGEGLKSLADGYIRYHFLLNYNFIINYTD